MSLPTRVPLYVQLAQDLHRQLEARVWQAGERMPSVRRLSRERCVSLSTAFQAYYYLESRGLLEARPKAGYFVRAQLHTAAQALAVPAPTTSAATGQEVRVSAPLAALFQAQTGQAVPFAVAKPSSDLLPVARLTKAMHTVLRTAGEAVAGYEQPAGNLLLRRQLAQLSARWGGGLAADDVIITNGCLEAVHLSLRAVTQPGDTVAVETPTYYGLLQCLESLGLRALEIATHPQTGVDLAELEAALGRQSIAACLFVPSFNNPLGSCMPDARKQQLVQLLTRWRVPLIEDDIYGELYFGPQRPRTCHSFDTEGWVLLCSSFSKQLAPGYRVGWVAPGRFHAQVLHLKYALNLATATLPQLAISEFLARGRYEHHLRQLRTAFAVQVGAMQQAVERHFPAGTQVTRPAGGFVLWVVLPEDVLTLPLHARAIQEGIGFIPGPLFSAQPRYAHCLRLTCGHPWSPEMARSLEALNRLLLP